MQSHFINVYRIVNSIGSVKVRGHINLLATYSINHRKIRFIADIYIRFSRNLDEKIDIRAKIEAVKLYTQLLC